MQRALSVEALVSAPVGQFFVGTTHLFWCHSPTLCGSIHWGRPTEREATEMTQLFELSRHPSLADGFDVVMDDRALELVDWRAFRILSEYVRRRLPEWAGTIRRQAVIVPSGVVGVMLAGLVPLLGMRHSIRFFSDTGSALDWIERDDASRVFADMERAADEARGHSPLLRALREHLEGALADATLESAARVLGRSPRALQRELRRLGTRFVAELTRARVRSACALLEHSDETVEQISRRVGCSSASQLSAIFRQELGETPARHRARRRAASDGS